MTLRSPSMFTKRFTAANPPHFGVSILIVVVLQGNLFSGLEDAFFVRAEVLADYSGKTQFKPEPNTSYYPSGVSHFQQPAPVPPPGLWFITKLFTYAVNLYYDGDFCFSLQQHATSFRIPSHQRPPQYTGRK